MVCARMRVLRKGLIGLVRSSFKVRMRSDTKAIMNESTIVNNLKGNKIGEAMNCKLQR
eukprot:XP_001705073.1 Hypothetical protein GL50803_39519 [Giardia lamblia ATCC 50803]